MASRRKRRSVAFHTLLLAGLGLSSLILNYSRKLVSSPEPNGLNVDPMRAIIYTPRIRAQLIVGELTYRIVKIEGKPSNEDKSNCDDKTGMKIK